MAMLLHKKHSRSGGGGAKGRCCHFWTGLCTLESTYMHEFASYMRSKHPVPFGPVRSCIYFPLLHVKNILRKLMESDLSGCRTAAATSAAGRARAVAVVTVAVAAGGYSSATATVEPASCRRLPPAKVAVALRWSHSYDHAVGCWAGAGAPQGVPA